MKQPSCLSTAHRQQGFSLVELTIVLVIVALLSGGLMLGLASQRDQIANKEAQQQQEMLRDALIGFAMTAGRLPCPADPALTTANGAGKEALVQCTKAECIATDTVCALEHGVVPWQALATQEVDPWGNRISYFVGHEFADPLIDKEIKDGVRTRFTLSTAGRANILDGAGNTLAQDIPAVIVSHGNRGNGAYQTTGIQMGGAANNEAENADADLSFITHTPNDTFDDLVSWIIPSLLKSRLVAVGKLP